MLIDTIKTQGKHFNGEGNLTLSPEGKTNYIDGIIKGDKTGSPGRWSSNLKIEQCQKPKNGKYNAM